jgi:hypothetical protein
MSRRSQAKRRHSYGRRQHEIAERRLQRSPARQPDQPHDQPLDELHDQRSPDRRRPGQASDNATAGGEFPRPDIE